MSLVVPNAAEIRALEYVLTPPLTLRIFGNNATPSPTSVAADFTEIAGGGYTNRPLLFAGWGFTSGNPSIALAVKESWIFTGAINAPGTIYGYFVTRDSDGLLMWAELFPALAIPFSPVVGSVVEVTPRFTGSSVY